MKRLFFLLVGLAAFAACYRAGAQPAAEPFGVYKADIGTLMRFIRSEITPAVYCVRDTSDHKSYTIRVPREAFLKKAFDTPLQTIKIFSRHGGDKDAIAPM